MEKRPQHCLTKCLKPKKPTFALKKQFHHQKPMLFIEKQSWITKNLEHHGKSITGPPKNSFFKKKRNDLLQKRKTLFENQICFEKSFQLQWKKRPQHRLTKCLKPKRPTRSFKTNFRYCQKLAKSNFQFLLIRILIRKSNHQNQDITTS